ncbi:MAG TPA: peptide-methionine (S)-S-oxide reductase MsrA [Leptolyngbyaceae cyanobacterium M33_DOE_097]|uniref:Peptide methionine sulfoxide reductase MsrA n=1 Tax=Oscillatoriales cyanobacterium SpSt-418 TaxID=2282169 RepID=A0A7C3KCQ7_9CYAN|nr:peptide-methionine (S)-S-oxide reductase MsrA [Leptolyngbyaceae cyanobacterium M33_DOE_097]
MLSRRLKYLPYLLVSLVAVSLATLAIAYNSIRAVVIPSPAMDTAMTANQGKQTAVFAGGCFWSMEAIFEDLKGVSDVVSGFSGGSAATAHYDQVSTGKTRHAEAVKITYDPAQISYGQLLKVYFSVAHDPTQVNRQGPDIGPQYRSAIFFANDEQKRVAQAYIDQLNRSKVFDAAIATQLAPFDTFYAAEDYHQNFIARNPNYPYVILHDMPKLNQLHQHFADLLKDSAVAKRN